MSHRGKQHYQCRDCRRQFVEDPQWQSKPKETKTLVNRLLHEKILLAGIARATGVSESWMQGHANAVYEVVPQTAEVIPKPTGPLTVQMDELWSFVDHQGNKQWGWLAIDAETRESLGSTGDRSRESAKALWQSIPAVYRQCAKVYTDFWDAYVTVIPSPRHEAVGQDRGLTSDIEPLNNTLRQRVSRLVRKTLSFSKKLENHIGAIWLFIHDYNRQIRQQRLEQGDSCPSFPLACTKMHYPLSWINCDSFK
jgi:insertion element IS1 protein InsB